MTVDEMYKALNKGLPVYLIVELDVDTLVNSCASDRAALINSIRKIKKNYQDAIVNLAGYSKAQHYFFKKLMVLTNTKNAEILPIEILTIGIYPRAISPPTIATIA